MKEDKKVQKLLEKIMNEMPLSTHLTVSIQLAMIDLLSAVGFRENKVWTDDEEDILSIIFDSAEKTAKQLEEDLMKDYGCSKTPIKKISSEEFKQTLTTEEQEQLFSNKPL